LNLKCKGLKSVVNWFGLCCAKIARKKENLFVTTEITISLLGLLGCATGAIELSIKPVQSKVCQNDIQYNMMNPSGGYYKELLPMNQLNKGK